MRVFFALGIIWGLSCGTVWAQENQLDSKEFYVPGGDTAAGRKAFVDLKCVACHRVAHDASLPAPFSANPGPTLNFSDAKNASEKIVTAVLAPSHSIAEGFGEGTPEEEQFSHMGDFADTMTVRQLRDIAAYLQS